MIHEIRYHFDLEEPTSDHEKDQLNRILSRHYVLCSYPHTLVVLPPKPNDAYMLRRNLPPVSKRA